MRCQRSIQVSSDGAGKCNSTLLRKRCTWLESWDLRELFLGKGNLRNRWRHVNVICSSACSGACGGAPLFAPTKIWSRLLWEKSSDCSDVRHELMWWGLLQMVESRTWARSWTLIAARCATWVRRSFICGPLSRNYMGRCNPHIPWDRLRSSVKQKSWFMIEHHIHREMF